MELAKVGPEGMLAAFETDPRRAVGEEGIVCLICGRTFRQLTNTHLRSHATSPLGYKQRFGYNRRRPLMCSAPRRLYAERAIRIRLADAIRRRPILTQPELRRRGGVRPVTLEEALTRRETRLAGRVSAFPSNEARRER